MLSIKSITIAFMLLILSASAYALNLTPQLTPTLTNDQWAILKKGEIIKRLEAMKGTEVKKGIAMGIVDAVVQDVWAVIHENNDFVHFMPSTLESILIDPSAVEEAKALKFDRATGDPKELIQFLKMHRAEKMTGTTGYFFSLLDVPWPATNRWYILKLVDLVTKDQWYQHFTLVMGNLKTTEGSWELIPLENDKTLTIYTVFSDPGGLIPDWVINIGTLQTLPEVIQGVRKRVKEEFWKK